MFVNLNSRISPQKINVIASDFTTRQTKDYFTNVFCKTVPVGHKSRQLKQGNI